MRQLILLSVALFSAACVGVIDNEGMGADGGSTGSMVTAGTTGSSVVATGVTTSASSTSGDTTSSTSSSTAGSGSGTSVGSSSTSTSSSTSSSSSGVGAGGAGGNGGTGGAGQGAGGSTSGAGGGQADASIGGSGGGRDAGGGGAGGGTTGPTFAQVKAIVQRNCASCHSSFTSYATFTSHRANPCGGDSLAQAGDPANSAFLELVQGQCSTLMPRGCKTAPCISAADIQTVTDWVKAGAPNN